MTDRFVLGRKPRIGDTGRKAEGHLTKRLKGRPTVNSGAMARDKGDVELPQFLVETKATEAESYGLKYELLRKITLEALRTKRKPAFHVQFVTGSGLPKKDGAWVMIPEALFDEIQQLWRERE